MVWYTHTHSIEYIYKITNLSNGIVVTCNYSSLVQICVYSNNNEVHYCPQYYTGNCIPFTTTCNITIDSITGQCNNFTLYPNIISDKQLKVDSVFMVILLALTAIVICLFSNIWEDKLDEIETNNANLT